MKHPRIACVALPHVAVAVAERDDPGLIGRPVAIAADRPGPPTVADVSYAAFLAGIAPGMPIAQARQMCPDLVVLPSPAAACRAAFQAMLKALAQFTAAVEPADLDRSWLSAEGLVPRGGAEHTLAAEVAGQVHRATGLQVRVGLAHGKLTSRIVTDYLQERDVMVLPAGKEVLFLGGLATRYLPLAGDVVQRLRRLGVTKVHQYAALPARGILPRFGYAGLRAHALAHGHDDPRVQPWAAEPVIEAAHTFLDPIANTRSLGFRIQQLAHRLAAPLAERYQVAGVLTLDIAFEDGARATRERLLLEPTSSPRVLTTHAEALAGDIPWRAPVERIRLAVRGLCATPGRQLALFRQQHEQADELTATLGRIQARFGDGAVLRGRLHEPDSPLHERRATVIPWKAAP